MCGKSWVLKAITICLVVLGCSAGITCLTPAQHEQNSCKRAMHLKTAQLCYDSAPSEICPTR
ncbi:hypothetical protein F6X59_09655 [Pseudomonas sp. MN1F]|nr:hypothetical protein [Pseudomonas sp. MN1F]